MASIVDQLPQSCQLVSVAQLSEMTGYIRRTIRDWHSDGLMPKGMRLGTKIFWTADVISAWMADGCPHQRSKPPGRPFRKADFLKAEASPENETLREVMTEYGERHNA